MTKALAFLCLVPLCGVAAELPVPAGVLLDRGVAYSSVPHGKLLMDVARPAAPGKYPGIVLIHGGGFSAGTREDSLPLAFELAQRGYVAAAVDYRLTPMYQFPGPVFDVKAAVRFLRGSAARFSVDKEHMGALGESAGATWAQFLAVTRNNPRFEGTGGHKDESSSVDCAVSWYGRSDMRRAYEGSRNAAAALPLLLGGDRASALDTHLRASPLNWITPDAAPVLAVHGTLDRNVPFEQSVWLVERLREAGVAAELETIAEAGHGFTGENAARALARTVDFFNRKLKPVPVETSQLLVNDHGAGRSIMALAWPSGRVLWRRPNGGATEVAALSGGHVLYIEDPRGLVTEIDSTQRVVWQYRTEKAGIVSIQRLANGNTLLVDDVAARVFEVSPEGRVVWSVEKPEYKGLAMRRARRTAQGTTLVAVQMAGVVLELDSAGQVLHQWNFPERRPALAVPQADGGMLVGLAGPGEVRRLDAAGKTVMTFGGLNDSARMAWTSGFSPTPEGGLIVSDYMGGRIVEFNGRGELVHQLDDLPWSVTSVSVVP